MKDAPIENQLFKWCEWEELDTASFNFIDCTFVQRVGKYKKGAKVALIEMNYTSSTMSVYNGLEDETPSAVFKMTLELEEVS